MAVGGRELHELAKRCRQADDKKLVARLRRGLSNATSDADSAIRDAFHEAMPKRGGYADVLAASMRVRKSVRLSGSTARVEVIVHADGARERRDLPRLNQGRLRHPVWGRSRRLASGRRRANPWATTTVPAGAFDRAVDQVARTVLDEMTKVHDDIAAAIMGS